MSPSSVLSMPSPVAEPAWLPFRHWEPQGFAVLPLDELQGQGWRLWSSALAHLSWEHLLLNGAGLLVLAMLAWRYGQRPWPFIRALLVCVPLSALLLSCVLPAGQWVVGLSGALVGLTWWLGARIKAAWLGVGLLVQAVALLKCLGWLSASEVSGYPVSLLAHWCGLAAGVVWLRAEAALPWLCKTLWAPLATKASAVLARVLAQF